MTAIEIITKKASKNFYDYTEEEREIIKAYGWEKYGMGVADTIRFELTEYSYNDYLELLDEVFC